jgi:DNA polymerase (family 10)
MKKKIRKTSRVLKQINQNIFFHIGMNIDFARTISEYIKKHVRYNKKRVRSHIVGSIRRNCKSSKDIDMLLVVNRFARNPTVTINGLSNVVTRSKGSRKISLMIFIFGRFINIDIFIAKKSEEPFALFHYTGSKDYNIRIRALSKKKGWKLNQYGIYSNKTGKKVKGSSKIKSEKSLAKFIGVRYRLPSERL